MKKQFRSRGEASTFLAQHGIDTSGWDDLKWLSLNKSQAEIHIQAAAEAMWDAMNESTPKQLQAGEWHIPFGDQIDEDAYQLAGRPVIDSDLPIKVKIATARCARLSYMTFDGKIDYAADIRLHDSLLEFKHASPFEHVARAMSDEEFSQYGIRTPYLSGHVTDNGWCRNFKGFISYRAMINL